MRCILQLLKDILILLFVPLWHKQGFAKRRKWSWENKRKDGNR